MTLFNSLDKIEDLLPKYRDMIPSFNFILIQIGSNNSQDDEVIIYLIDSALGKNMTMCLNDSLKIQLAQIYGKRKSKLTV